MGSGPEIGGKKGEDQGAEGCQQGMGPRRVPSRMWTNKRFRTNNQT